MLKPFTFFFAGLFSTPSPAKQPPPTMPKVVVVQPKRVAAAPTAAEIVAGVQKFYASISGVKALFRQEVTNATFGRSDISDGQLLISKPGKMRWDYFAKKKKKEEKTKLAKEFISNGSYLYVVDHENKQIIRKDLQKNLLPTAVTFLYGKGNLADDFNPELDKTGTFGTKADHVLRLTPKVPSAQYKHLYLVVDPANFRVKESIIIDAAGNKNHFRFFAPDFSSKPDAKQFEFSEKADRVKSYRVVDGDALAPPTKTAPAIK